MSNNDSHAVLRTSNMVRSITGAVLGTVGIVAGAVAGWTWLGDNAVQRHSLIEWRELVDARLDEIEEQLESRP